VILLDLIFIHVMNIPLTSGILIVWVPLSNVWNIWKPDVSGIKKRSRQIHSRVMHAKNVLFALHNGLNAGNPRSISLGKRGKPN
jgi:hypothetical protein